MNEPAAAELARAYHSFARAHEHAPVSVEPEAQLTVPISQLVTGAAAAIGAGEWKLLRETQLPGVRPDFAVMANDRFLGWIELKAPGTGVDPSKWLGRNAKQWERLSQLDNLIVTDGIQLARYVSGVQEGAPIVLPFHSERWDARGFEAHLRQFASRHVAPIRSASDLAKRLAPLARDLRDRISANIAVRPLQRALRIWQELLQEDMNDHSFADALAQVISYGLVIATLDGDGDVDGDGIVSLEEAFATLRTSHKVLAATIDPIIQIDGMRELLRAEIGAIERLLGAADPVSIAGRKDPRGDAWLWFYEDFLGAYDPGARKESGVYYTPIPIVEKMTDLTQEVLIERFGRPLGFGDEEVVTLDPAAGTGTFPLAVIDAASRRATELRGPAGPGQIADGLASRLFGFEILPGPYAVAHLRVGERLRMEGVLSHTPEPQIMLADTLDTPTDNSGPQLQLFGSAEVLANERIRARRFKREQSVVAIIGNPPYRRVTRAEGGWVATGVLGKLARGVRSKQSLFQDVIDIGSKHTIFSHVASAYNLYTFFWRWAIWKAFELHGGGPAVVSFITASSWLDGPGLVGLRQRIREQADEIWIIDLGGDNRASERDENVFTIETPVCIAIAIRDGEGDITSPAKAYYQRVTGTRVQKLAGVSCVKSPAVDVSQWTALPDNFHASLRPSVGSDAWQELPPLQSLLPWQQPGVMFNRTWPIAPDPNTLERRWRALMAGSTTKLRAEMFPNPRTGRQIDTRVGSLTPLSELPLDAPAPTPRRYMWRAFDRQWAMPDARLAALQRPALQSTIGPKQIFFVTLGTAALGAGPAVLATVDLPDKHAFSGRGGKDVFPLYRDVHALHPNLPAKLLKSIGIAHRKKVPGTPDPAAEDLAAYLYGLLHSRAYTERFATELPEKLVRVPLTRDPLLWGRVVQLGSRMLRLHTYGLRYSRALPFESDVAKNIGWLRAVTRPPVSRADITYDEATKTLHVGDGVVQNVPSAVWQYEVSGWEVVKKWLYYRTLNGYGRSSSSLDKVRASTWLDVFNDELLELLRMLATTIEQEPIVAALLDEVMCTELIKAADLPKPAKSETATPDYSTVEEVPQLFVD